MTHRGIEILDLDGRTVGQVLIAPPSILAAKRHVQPVLNPP